MSGSKYPKKFSTCQKFTKGPRNWRLKRTRKGSGESSSRPGVFDQPIPTLEVLADLAAIYDHPIALTESPDEIMKFAHLESEFGFLAACYENVLLVTLVLLMTCNVDG